MSVYNVFNAMYQHAIKDEQLMRLLHYAPQTFDDDVTVKTSVRPDVANEYDVISKVVKARSRNDKDLTNDEKGNMLFITLDNFENQLQSGKLNPDLFSHLINFEIYVHEDSQNIAFTLAKVVDRVMTLYNNKLIAGLQNTYLTSSAKLTDVENYVGMSIQFKVVYSR